MELALAHGADMHHRTLDGATAMLLATWRKDLRMLLILLHYELALSGLGVPSAALQQDGVVRDAFSEMARNVVSSLADRVTNLPPTEAVRITTMAGCKTKKREV